MGHEHFRIVTWNVGYFAPLSDKNMRDLDIAEVSEILRGVDAHVILLQELREVEQAEQIAEGIGEGWSPYPVQTGHGEQVLSVLTSLPVVFEEEIVCGGRAAKGLTVLTPSGEHVYVLGVHSPHPARGVTENLESIECSLEHVKARSEEVRLVGGDLNYNFDGGSDGRLYTEILEDFGDGTVGIGETYYAHTRIDHVFHYPKNLQVVEEESGMIDLSVRFGGVPGFRDHRPVVVSYRLSGRGAIL